MFGTVRLRGARVLGFCVFMLWRGLVIELDKILLAATTTVVKLLFVSHLIEVCARAALAAGLRLLYSEKHWYLRELVRSVQLRSPTRL